MKELESEFLSVKSLRFFVAALEKFFDQIKFFVLIYDPDRIDLIEGSYYRAHISLAIQLYSTRSLTPALERSIESALGLDLFGLEDFGVVRNKDADIVMYIQAAVPHQWIQTDYVLFDKKNQIDITDIEDLSGLDHLQGKDGFYIPSSVPSGGSLGSVVRGFEAEICFKAEVTTGMRRFGILPETPDPNEAPYPIYLFYLVLEKRSEDSPHRSTIIEAHPWPLSFSPMNGFIDRLFNLLFNPFNTVNLKDSDYLFSMGSTLKDSGFLLFPIGI